MVRNRGKLLQILFSTIIISCINKKSQSVELLNFQQINDSITAIGVKKNDLEYGIWKFFDMNDNLIGIIEFKIINNKSFHNQAICFNKDSDTIFEKTSFYKFKYENDSILNIKFVSLLDKNFEGKNDAILLYNKNIKEDFSNLKDLDLDTLYFNNKYDVQLINKSKNFKGIIREIHLRKSDSISLQRDVYVDINLNSKNFPH